MTEATETAEANELNLDAISKEDLLRLLKGAFHAFDRLGNSLGDTLRVYDQDEWCELDTEVTDACTIDDAMAEIANGLKEVVKVEYKPIFGPEDREYVDNIDWGEDDDDDDDDENDDENDEDDEK